MKARQRDLDAGRWQPFTHIISFEGLNFSAATMEMQVRLYRDAPGDPIIGLVNAASNAEGLSASYVDATNSSLVQIRINETTLEAVLLNAGKPGDDVRLVYDLVITGGGFPKTRWLQGTFTILAGVTQ